MIFERIANVVQRFHKAIVVFWILAFAFATILNTLYPLADVLNYSQASALPGDTESARAQDLLEAAFPSRTVESRINLVLVGDDMTDRLERSFAVDLHEAIIRSQNVSGDNPVTYTLATGRVIALDRPVRYLLDPSNASLYAIEESFVAALAGQFDDIVAPQVSLAQGSASVYYGTAAYFLGVWQGVGGGSLGNDTAYNETVAYLASLPPDQATWAQGYFGVFYPVWLGSWFNTSLVTLSPPQRVEHTVHTAAAGYLFSQDLPDEVRYFQLGAINVVGLANFTDVARLEDYTFETLGSLGLAEPAFFARVYADLPPGSPEADVRAFARRIVLDYDPFSLPVTLPVNVTKFFLSADRTILIMNYEFSKGSRYREPDGTEPILDDVRDVRHVVTQIREAYGGVPVVYVAGEAAADLDQQLTAGEGLEFIATVVLIIVLIGVYFRSVVSPFFPIGTISIAIGIATAFVYLLSFFLAIDFTLTAVLQTVLLATGTDYSIFLISRYRDERRDGKTKEEAIRQSVIWAGESIATSGGAVMLSFAALSLGSFPFVRLMGIAVGFGVTIAILLSLTLIPSIILLIGNRVFWPSMKRMGEKRTDMRLSLTERYFRRSAGFSMRRARAILLVALLISVPAIYITLTDVPTFDFTEGAERTESLVGGEVVADAFGAGLFFRGYVVAVFPTAVRLADGNLSAPAIAALASLRDRLAARTDLVASVDGPTSPQGSAIDLGNLSSLPPEERQAVLASVYPYIGTDDRTVVTYFVLHAEPFSVEALSAVDDLNAAVRELSSSEPGLRDVPLLMGGVSAILRDVRDNTNRDLLVMAAVVITGLFLVLLFVLGSVLIPLRAILTIVLSITWTLAATIVLFQFWKGIDVFFIIPLIVFVLAMGLGMDYDIFIITRVREEVSKGKTDRRAIYTAMTRTGGIISACGIVMAGAFLTLMISPTPLLQQIGFALAFVILLDSMIVRIYLVPAIMVLAGKYNWWAPGRLQRVRRDEKLRAARTDGDSDSLDR